MAEKARSRHRLVVNVLVAIGAPWEAAETDAEGMEHYVSDTTMTATKRFLVDRLTPGEWS
jgi:DtxR family manganese transport transcriptional regulator